MDRNQDIYVSRTRVATVFRESPDDWSPIKACRHCVLWKSADCDRVACTPEFREDGRDGYYTVQDLPERGTPKNVGLPH